VKSSAKFSLKHTLQAATVAALLSVGLGAQADEPPHPDPAACQERVGEMLQRMQQHLQQRLDRLAQALKLQAGQQAAWKEYANAELAVPAPWPCPKAEANPLEMAQDRAEHARLMADKLTASSKALAALWQTLSPAQRQTFQSLSRPGMPHRSGMMGGMHEGAPAMPDGMPPQ
jgi:hypothetical protein